MIHEFHVVDLAESGQVQLQAVNADEHIETPPTSFPILLEASDRREMEWYFLDLSLIHI